MINNLKKLSVIILDVLLIFTSFLIVLIIITGGTKFHINDQVIFMYSAQNPTIILFILTLFRISLPEIPLLCLNLPSPKKISDKVEDWVSRNFSLGQKFHDQKIHRILWAIILISATIKLYNAWHYYGFFSGDDVEVLELAFSELQSWDWQAWNLRSPFFPMVFIFPPLKLLQSIGISDPGLLIFFARTVSILFSSLSIWILYRITQREFMNDFISLSAAAFLAFCHLHITFAASVMPRICSSFFLLLSFYYLGKNDHKNIHLFLAGLAMGIAGAIRFSEIIFLLPGIIYLVSKRIPINQIIVFGATGFLSFVLIILLGDCLYWNVPFYSFRNIVDYTLVNKLSSRGYQSAFFYISHINQWLNVFIMILAVRALGFKKQWLIHQWWILPLIILSFLPHKEPRYLIPIIPFITLSVVMTLRHYSEKHLSGIKSHRFNSSLKWVIFLVLFSYIFEISGYLFKRSESAVRVAQILRTQAEKVHIAAQQSWKLGGSYIFLMQILKIFLIIE